jgi:hypothetical protein
MNSRVAIRVPNESANAWPGEPSEKARTGVTELMRIDANAGSKLRDQ